MKNLTMRAIDIMTWTISIAITAVAIGWLAMQNPRAIPIGALLSALAFVIAFSMHLVALAKSKHALTIWILVVVTLVGLILLNLAWMEGSLGRRLLWAVGSMLIWSFLLIPKLGEAGKQLAKILPASAAVKASRKEEAEAAAKVQRLRGELDRFPERRRAVLDRVLEEERAGMAQSGRQPRIVVFGDPATAPEHVVVWLVLTPVGRAWEEFFYYGHEQYRRVNTSLRQQGYPAEIKLGLAPSAEVDRAGGDQAYFGREGTAVVPQFPAEHRPDVTRRQLEMPRRKGNEE
ncbi:MAG: hypothetical protein HY700_06955 [Gemmatimonadetes bacterium]|nr:hypothetical protein [Gemmatimonadota bacterium]